MYILTITLHSFLYFHVLFYYMSFTEINALHMLLVNLKTTLQCSSRFIDEETKVREISSDTVEFNN